MQVGDAPVGPRPTHLEPRETVPDRHPAANFAKRIPAPSPYDHGPQRAGGAGIANCDSAAAMSSAAK